MCKSKKGNLMKQIHGHIMIFTGISDYELSNLEF